MYQQSISSSFQFQNPSFSKHTFQSEVVLNKVFDFIFNILWPQWTFGGHKIVAFTCEYVLNLTSSPCFFFFFIITLSQVSIICYPLLFHYVFLLSNILEPIISKTVKITVPHTNPKSQHSLFFLAPSPHSSSL